MSHYHENKNKNENEINNDSFYLPMVKYFAKYGADIITKETMKLACKNGHLHMVKYLVEHGVNVTADHNESVKLACENGHLPVVEYLVEHGAKIPICDNYIIRGLEIIIFVGLIVITLIFL